MLEPPSAELLKRLSDLKLCTRRDLKRCRPRVRRLARDLPAFDSVWLDGLVEARTLTSFQARVLESSAPQQLGVGPFVLMDRLGSSSTSETFVACRRRGKGLFALKRMRVSPEKQQQVLDALTRLIGRTRSLSQKSSCVLLGAHCVDREIVCVSRLVSGPTLKDILIRRGRLPGSIVGPIGRQLISAVAGFEAAGVVHGDVRLENMRLTSGARAVLVDCGIGTSVNPTLLIDASTPPHRYDGTAPELIGTGRGPTTQSDLYAIGCLLWHLLAGRPPFPTGDALAKLSAQQTQGVPDVREWAPETSAELANAINWLTHHAPEERPESAEAAQMSFRRWRRGGNKGLKQLAGNVRPSGRTVERGSKLRLSVSAVVAVVLLAALFVTSPLAKGIRPQLLQLVSSVSNRLGHTGGLWSTAPAEDARTDRSTELVASGRFRPLPPPDSTGVMTLASGVDYDCGTIAVAGPLTIQSDGLRPARLIVAEQPLVVTCEELQLRNLVVEAESPSDQGEDALVVVKSHRLKVSGCRFGRGLSEPPSESTTSGGAFVQWSPVDVQDRSGGTVSLADSVFHGAGAVLRTTWVARRMTMRNCLKVGGGVLLEATTIPPASQVSEVSLSNVTSRGSSGILEIIAGNNGERSGNLQLELQDCLFHFGGSSSALVGWTSQGFRRDWTESVRINGRGSVVTPNVVLARVHDPTTSERRILSDTAIAFEGLAVGDVTFSGRPDDIPAGSLVTHVDALRPAGTQLGFEPPRLNAARDVARD